MTQKYSNENEVSTKKLYDAYRMNLSTLTTFQSHERKTSSTQKLSGH